MVVARVNDQSIYKEEVDQALAAVVKQRQIDADQMPRFQAAMLAQLISQRLVFDLIKEQNLIATSEEIDAQVEHLTNQLKVRKILLSQYMRQLGLTRATLRTRLGNEISLKKLLNHYGPEDRLQEYFKQNARQFDGTELRVSHILLRPRGTGSQGEMDEMLAQAKKIKSQIDAGSITFAEAAKKYSAGPSRTEGGDLGFIGRKGPMVEAFNRAAFSLEKGQVSEPVATDFGIHLITVTDVRPGGKALADVRNQVEAQFSQWIIDQLIEKQIERAKIEFNENFPHYNPGTRELAAAGR
jgi:peptidyl-prolyl cis-trans isomerase C